MEHHVLHNVAKWNKRQAEIAERDMNNPDLKVPNGPRYSVYPRFSIHNAGIKLEPRPMTQEEYRASRQRDYIRHRANVTALEKA